MTDTRALTLHCGRNVLRDREVLRQRIANTADPQPFHNSGSTLTGGPTSAHNSEPLGWLGDLTRYRASGDGTVVRTFYRMSLDTARYVIRSYGTPIAWNVRNPLTTECGQWVMPGASSDIEWSATTRRHISIVRFALRDVSPSILEF